MWRIFTPICACHCRYHPKLRMLADVTIKGTRLKGGSPALRNDHQVCHVAASQDVHALEFASEEVCDDGVFMLAGIYLVQ